MSREAEPSPIYLDHAATSWPKPAPVREATLRSLTDMMANAGRSGHGPAIESARIVFETREHCANLIGARRSEDVIFVRGCTEGLNLVIKGFLRPADTVVVSPMEHNAMMRPLARMATQSGIQVVTLPADPFGRIDYEAARKVARAHQPPALLAVAHASNVNGIVQDLHALHELFPHTPLLVDAAQTAGVLPLDVERDTISFLACSAHKGLLGPTGVGICYLAPTCDVTPLLEGGTGSRSESFEHPTFRPDRYEAGTLNLLGIAGTMGALEFLAQGEPQGHHKRQLTGILLKGLRAIPGVHLQSPLDGSALCASFTIDGLRPDEIAVRLERSGVLGRPGLQCAPAAHRHLGTFPHGTMRLSPGWGNTPEHIETALRAIHAIAQNA